MAKKEIILPGYGSELNSFARKEKRREKQEYKRIKKDNKEKMEFPFLKTLPKAYYEIPNPDNRKIIKRGDQFPDEIKPLNAQKIELPWYLSLYYETKIKILLLKDKVK